MSPLSGDPDARRRQLANLTKPPPPEIGNQRRLVHGGRSELLLRDVSAEIRELMDALAEGAPVRDPDGGLPTADVVAVERAARALKRYRHLTTWLDLHGRLDEKGGVRPAAELELKAERSLDLALDSLGMNPMARSKLGVNLARTFDAAEYWAGRDD